MVYYTNNNIFLANSSSRPLHKDPDPVEVEGIGTVREDMKVSLIVIRR